MTIANGSGIFTAGDRFASPAYYHSSLLGKYGNLSLGGEFLWSGAKKIVGSNKSNNKGYTLVSKYKVMPSLSVALQYFYIEGMSVPGDGVFSSDDFISAGSGGVSNFKGTRVKVKYSLNKYVAIDFNWYNQDSIDSTLAALNAGGTVTQGFWNRNSTNRFQLNTVLKF